MEESQKELALLKGERDDAIRKSAAIESRFSDMQVSDIILSNVIFVFFCFDCM